MPTEPPPTTTDATAAVPAVWEPGSVVLGQYRVDAVHEGGAMGLVYRVHHLGWGMDLAVKSPRPEVLARAGGADRFRDEAETWVRLGPNPHVVTCFYVRTLGGVPRVFAEYVAGGTLHDWVADGRLYVGGPGEVLARVLDVAIQFAWGLGFAHGTGLIHQDVKPGNVMMTPGGGAKVTDFGLARAAGGGYGGGTPAYYSAEQAQARAEAKAGAGGRTRLTAQSDLWSWAVSVLDLFAGGVSCRYGGQLAGEVLAEFLAAGGPGGTVPPMPAGVAELLRRCFCLDPADRPAGLDEAADACRTEYETATGTAYPRSRPNPGANPADGLNNLGVSLLDLGRGADADAAFAAALRAAPQHPEATYNAVLRRWRAGAATDTDALRDIRGVAGGPGREWVGSYLAGLVHLERGDPTAAATEFERAAHIAPAEAEVQVALAAARKAVGTGRGDPREFTGRDGFSLGPDVLGVSPDGRSVVSGGVSAIDLWDAATGRHVRAFAGHVGDRERSPPVLGSANAVAPTADGRYAVSAGDDRTLKVWDLATGACVRTLTGHTDWVRAVAVTTNGRYAVSGSGGDIRPKGEQGEDAVRVFDLTTGRCVRLLRGHAGTVHAIALGAGGRVALSGSMDGTARLWDLRAGCCTATLGEHPGGVNAVWLDAAARTAVTAGQDGLMRVWDVPTGQCVRELAGHVRAVRALALTADVRRALSVGEDDYLRLWDVPAGRCLWSQEVRWGWRQGSVAIAPAGDTGFHADGRAVTAWRLDAPGLRPAPPALCRATTSEVVSAAEAEFRRDLAAARAAPPSVAAAHVRSARDRPGCGRRPEATAAWAGLYAQLPRGAFRGAWADGAFPAHAGPITGLRLGRVTDVCVTAGEDGRVRVWDAAAGEFVRDLTNPAGWVGALALDPDDRLAAWAAEDDVVRVWDVTTGRPVRALPTGRSCRAVALLPGGAVLTGHADGTLRRWAADADQCVWECQSHPGPNPIVHHLAAAPDGTRAATCGFDATIRVWDAATGAAVHVLRRHTEVVEDFAFTADGLVSGGLDKSLKWWDAESGRRVASLDGPSLVLAVAASQDGRVVVSGDHDHAVRVWEAAGGRCLATLEGHAGPVRAVALDRHARFALSGGEDGTLRRWFLDWDLPIPTAPDPLPTETSR
ncbi:WD40 repeat domain-containing serine/threonine-protein kinase [Urbifossiella limnaea]|uniref:Serine/threonine-protein kinase PrkC n=1 Tax=Urbifossiella limnaea TaxID=2528023 RepID=A0A517Y253_9BACT|nr:WD40 repeat domain-containing serine/threonine-protein kinase [Urbifossiella limnaea]QDU23778.1 Serine/threonine-protein kinase PrkC [Urbifossiella limnaea]